MRVGDLLEVLDARFPLADAASWDPVGLQIGGTARGASSVGVCHEVTDDVVTRAMADGLDTIVSYHPLLFVPTTAFVDGPGAVGRALRLAQAGISLVVVHTALDAAQPGTGDALIEALGFPQGVRLHDLEQPEASLIGRVTTLDEALAPDVLAARVSNALSVPVRMTESIRDIRTVAVLPGSGGGFIPFAAGAADAVITGDVGHHRAREATELGALVIDAGHAATERPGVMALYSVILDVVPDATFVEGDRSPWKG